MYYSTVYCSNTINTIFFVVKLKYLKGKTVYASLNTSYDRMISQHFLYNIARKSTDSLIDFASGLAVVWRCVSQKAKIRLRWDLNPGPLLLEYNG